MIPVRWATRITRRRAELCHGARRVGIGVVLVGTMAAPLPQPLAVLGARPLHAQAARTDTVPPLFTGNDLVFAAGVGIATIVISPLDKKIATYMQGRPQAIRFLHNATRDVEYIAFPGAFVIGGGLYAAGRINHDRRMASLGLHGTEAILFGLGVTTALKWTVGRARPYVDRNPRDFGLGRGWSKEQFRSFPSGHTLIAFAAASAVTEETLHWWPDARWIIGPVLYTGATAVGLSRLFNNMHWASDVIMGGAMGGFAGYKVVRYTTTHPNNQFDRWMLGAIVTPTPGGHMVSFMMSPMHR